MKIAVIIPAYNAEATLGLCLERLLANQGPAFDILVVDDASQDGTRAVARRYPCTLIPMEQNGGPGAARNAGAARSQADLLLFLDADCAAPLDWVARYAHLFAAHSDMACICSGYNTALTHSFWARFQYRDTLYNQQFTPRHPRWASSCNFGCRREAFWRAGGFPEIYLNEEMEFFYFLTETDRILWEPTLGARHHFHTTMRAYARQQRGWGASVVETYMKYPPIFFAEGTVDQAGLSGQLALTGCIPIGLALLFVNVGWGVLLLLGLLGGILGLNIQFLQYLKANESQGFCFRAVPAILLRNGVWFTGMLHAALRNFRRWPAFVRYGLTRR